MTMQNRYVGDVGDFAKYALLRRLAGRPTEEALRLGIVWCLFPDESHNNDGRHVSYLRAPGFASLDDDLRVRLERIVRSGRSIAAIQETSILPPDTVFCDASASPRPGKKLTRQERLRHRLEWATECFEATEGCDLIFFDPDNGLEVASVAKHQPGGGKYMYWDELAPFWERGDALLVYHHLNRTMSAAEQVKELAERICTKLDGAFAIPLVFRRGSCRVFWLVHNGSEQGLELERRALQLLSAGWASHFRPAGWPQMVKSISRPDGP
jgi:hypothetical protein